MPTDVIGNSGQLDFPQISGKSAKDVADELGIDSTNLKRWLRESKEGESSNLRVFPGQGNPRDEEVARLKRELADLQETNEILKKQWLSLW